MWASFAPTAVFTTPVAAHLVDFAQIRAGETVLDVGTGTGVVAVTAARAGASVTGVDLTPALLDAATENSRLAGVDIKWLQGDAEDLPVPDRQFDVVLSQFGHIFAPRPEVTVAEMCRVLKPGGRIAFASWPPEHFVGQLIAFIGRHSPPPPAGAAPPPLWGSPPIVAERLQARFEAASFTRGVMQLPALSLAHFWEFVQRSVGPVQKLAEQVAIDPLKLSALRCEFETLAAPYYSGNLVRHDYLLTRAKLL